MAITLRNVTKSFGGDPVVRDVSLDIAAGEFFVILGPSGCGKTTLLRMIAGLETPDEGRIALDGTGVFDGGINLAPEKRNVGVVFQSYALWPHMTVRDNVAFPVETRRLPRAEVNAIVDRSLAAVGLTDFAGRRPAALSGGQRQRVALARCLAQQARTILMDEPLANLDPHLRATMEEELGRFHSETGATTFFITHDQREAMALADRIAVMRDGAIRQVDTPERIFAEPVDEMVARFVGQSTIVSAEVVAARGDGVLLSLAGRDIAARTAGPMAPGPCRVVIRPQDVHLDEGGMPARVTRTTYRGGSWDTSLKVNGLDDVLTARLSVKPTIDEELALAVASPWVLPR